MRSTLTVRQPDEQRLRRVKQASTIALGGAGLLMVVALVWQLASSGRDAGQTALVCAGLLLWGSNVLFAIPRWTSRLVFLFFHGSFALFILGQPLASLFGGSRLKMPVTRDGAMEALWMVALSLLAVRAGLWVVERRITPRLAEDRDRPLPAPLNRQAFTLMLIGTGIAVLCNLANGIDALLYVREHNYSSYYVSHESRLPFAVGLVGMMAPYLVAGVLALFPRGRMFPILCGTYFLMTMPYLAMGQRGSFIRMLIFLGSLVVIRWLAFGERTLRVKVTSAIAIAVAIPLVVLAMGWIGQSRTTTVTEKAKQEASKDTPTDPTEAKAREERIKQSNSVAAQFEAQSVTFSVIARGAAFKDKFPDSKCYTLGPITDSVFYGNPGRKIFGNEDLGGQTVRRATVGSNFGHAFSYKFYGRDYLDGLGSGSSYLIENYVDGGFPLVVLFSLLLGGLLSCLTSGYRRSVLVNMILLIILEGIITLPRDAATGFLTFLVLPPFLAALFCVWFVTRPAVQRFLAEKMPWLGLVGQNEGASAQAVPVTQVS